MPRGEHCVNRKQPQEMPSEGTSVVNNPLIKILFSGGGDIPFQLGICGFDDVLFSCHIDGSMLPVLCFCGVYVSRDHTRFPC